MIFELRTMHTLKCPPALVYRIRIDLLSDRPLLEPFVPTPAVLTSEGIGSVAIRFVQPITLSVN